MPTVMGIDPGLKGGIVVVSAEGATGYRMPTHMVKRGNKGKLRVNAPGLTKLIGRWEPDLVAIEEVHAMPGQGVTSMFSFGRAFGLAEGICAGMQLSYIMVQPGEWKRHMKLTGKSKGASMELAGRLYPDLDLSRKADEGIAEAALIAAFAAYRYSI